MYATEHDPPATAEPLKLLQQALGFRRLRTIGDWITVRNQEIAKHNQYSRLQQNLQKKTVVFEAMFFLKKNHWLWQGLDRI